MKNIRSIAAMQLLMVWSVITIYTVLSNHDTVLLQVISPPLFLLVGGLIGVDLKRAWKNGGEENGG